MADTSIASTVDEAIAVLRWDRHIFSRYYDSFITDSVLISVNTDEADRHPEKRMKAAYKAFEAEHLPRIKAENPSMRLSQWKQIMHREWTKSPQNPLNNKD